MGYILQGYLVIVLEIICCKIFFDTFCKQSIALKHSRFVSLFILSIIDVLVVHFLSENFLFKEMLVIIFTSLVMRFYTGKSFRINVILTIIYQGILLITDYITIVVQTVFFPKVDVASAILGMMVLLLDKVILFLIIIVIKSLFCEKEFEVLQDVDWLKFLFFPVFTICVITAMISNGIRDVSVSENEISIVIAFGLVGMNVVVFYLLNDIVLRENKLRENQIFELETRNKLQLYETLSENIKKQRKLSHEYHNQINLIQELCQRREIDELQKYLIEINGELMHDIDCIDTHHVIINTIVNQKYYEATNKGILFLCKINDMRRLNMKNQDIALLLSNLLNNAIEGCERCTSSKIIKLKLIWEPSKLILSVKNTYDGRLVKKDDEILTTKNNDTESHGYGLKNVIKIIENNNGDYVIKTTEKEFYISICIPQNMEVSFSR